MSAQRAGVWIVGRASCLPPHRYLGSGSAPGLSGISSRERSRCQTWVTRSRTMRRSPWIAIAAAAVLGVAASSAAAAPDKPTIVLVHGAFADSSSWNGVIADLQRDGYTVVAAANPLRGIVSDATYVASVVKSVHGPVVLVGHSYGGAVISQAGAAPGNVKALVYV